MAQYRVLASEWRQRYSVYTKTPKNIKEKKLMRKQPGESVFSKRLVPVTHLAFGLVCIKPISCKLSELEDAYMDSLISHFKCLVNPLGHLWVMDSRRSLAIL
jgi:hypothetical protein